MELLNLPPHIVKYIFRLLDSQSQNSLSSTCKEIFNRVFSAEDPWKLEKIKCEDLSRFSYKSWEGQTAFNGTTFQYQYDEFTKFFSLLWDPPTPQVDQYGDLSWNQGFLEPVPEGVPGVPCVIKNGVLFVYSKEGALLYRSKTGASHVAQAVQKKDKVFVSLCSERDDKGCYFKIELLTLNLGALSIPASLTPSSMGVQGFKRHKKTPGGKPPRVKQSAS